MIVKDEEASLKECLSPIKDLLDEIIIVDTGSSDRTKDIAKSFTDKVYSFKWSDDFSSARNLSISRASKSWILVLDPDENISKHDLIKIKGILSSCKDKDILGYRLIQNSYHDGRVISVRGICRVFRNAPEIRFDYPIHETVRESIKKLGGRIGKTGIAIRHHPKLSREKTRYYLQLLNTKKEMFPDSKADKEIENELNLNPR